MLRVSFGLLIVLAIIALVVYPCPVPPDQPTATPIPPIDTSAPPQDTPIPNATSTQPNDAITPSHGTPTPHHDKPLTGIHGDAWKTEFPRIDSLPDTGGGMPLEQRLLLAILMTLIVGIVVVVTIVIALSYTHRRH